MGTLFDLAPLRERLGEAATEAWFQRILHSAATVTLLGEFVPFAELARTGTSSPRSARGCTQSG
jgi:hypothetical protein